MESTDEGVLALRTDPPWAVPASVLMVSVDKLIEIAKGLDETVEPVVGFGFLSPPLADVDHDELWLAMLKAVRHQQPVFIEHEGFLEIKLHQNVYVKEHANEILFHELVNRKEQNIERTIVLRDHPREIEVCECKIHSGSRVHSEMTEIDAKMPLDGLVDSAKLN